MRLKADMNPTPDRIDGNTTTARWLVSRSIRFWLAYLPCAVISFLLNPTLDQLVFGRGHFGNPLLMCFHIIAFLLTTIAVALPVFSTIRRWRYSWLAGLLLGLASQAVTYVLAIVI